MIILLERNIFSSLHRSLIPYVAVEFLDRSSHASLKTSLPLLSIVATFRMPESTEFLPLRT